MEERNTNAPRHRRILNAGWTLTARRTLTAGRTLTARRIPTAGRILTAVLILGGIASVGCSDDEEEPNLRPDATTGAACESAEECFSDVDEGELVGEARCLTKLDTGYCTHTCESDAECCAAEGECPNDFNQVCSPFEDSNETLCFLSCEQEDLDAAAAQWEEPPESEDDYCQRGAGSDFICRSTGGGADNRKVCVPGECGVGADCTGDEDCAGDLFCSTDFAGGYCTAPCEGDADCPEDSVCATQGDETLCLRTCAGDATCSACRADGTEGTCVEDAELIDSESGTPVCSPRQIE